MKKIFLITLVVLFAWSAFAEAQTSQYDAYRRIKWQTTVFDTVIGPNNESDYIYFPMYDNQSGEFFDSVFVIITLAEVIAANMDSVLIGFDYSPDNTNWVGTLLDSHFVANAAAVVWIHAIPPNTGGVNALPFPRYGRLTFWGSMSTGAADSSVVTSYTIYGYKKPTTLIRVRE